MQKGLGSDYERSFKMVQWCSGVVVHWTTTLILRALAEMPTGGRQLLDLNPQCFAPASATCLLQTDGMQTHLAAFATIHFLK